MYKYLLALLLCLLTVNSFSGTQSVSLAWDECPATNTTGYIVYWGTASGEYSEMKDLGNVTNTTVTGLIQGSNYFFVVTAYDTARKETDPSNEVSYQVPSWIIPTKPRNLRVK